MTRQPGTSATSAVPAPTRNLYPQDRKSTRLNSSHLVISYAVFCLKKTVATFAAEGSSSLRAQGIDVSFPLWRRLIGPPRLEAETDARRAAGIAGALGATASRAYTA